MKDVAGASGNNFGFLRLLFAWLVIVAHSPELVDGNRSREILSGVFHTLSIGTVAVGGFFLVSGYLIVKSWDELPDLGRFALKRGVRILPGFGVAFALSWLVVGPLAGGHVGADGYVMQALRLVTLQAPELGDAFVGMPYTALNGPMWTIAYEVRCYLAAAVLGLAGAYRHRARYVAVAAAAVLVFVFLPEIDPPRWVVRLTGRPHDNAMFLVVFLAGGAFYVFRDRIVLDGRVALGAAVGLVATMAVSDDVAMLGIAVFGGYILFWFALAVRAPRLARIGGRVDISYGVYLYAWPVQNLVIQRAGEISPWLVTGVATPVAAMLGYVSWRLVEAPCLALGRRIMGRRAT